MNILTENLSKSSNFLNHQETHMQTQFLKKQFIKEVISKTNNGIQWAVMYNAQNSFG